MVEWARATKDIDFVVDVVKMRGKPLSLGAQLEQLGYAVVTDPVTSTLRNRFRTAPETVGIEFSAPEEFKREKDFRVDIRHGVSSPVLGWVPATDQSLVSW